MAERLTVERLTRLLRARLGALGAGGRLPTVRELMREFGVGQSLIGQALQTLKREGLIESHVGRGTFATEAAALRQILWVCGMDLFHGEISPYYAQALRLAKEIGLRRGWSVTPAWLSNFRPEDAEPYCAADSVDPYLGFFFIGCSDLHPLLRYVIRERLPFTRIAFELAPTKRVVASPSEALRKAMAHFAGRGCRRVGTIADAKLFPLARELGEELGMAVELLPVHFETTWLSTIQREGYRCMAERLGAGPLPDGIFVQDDIVAWGVSRALLEHCPAAQRCHLELAVCSTLQTMIPLGVPVTYLAFDIAAAVEAAYDMLAEHLAGDPDPAGVRRVEFQLVPSEGMPAASGAPAAAPAATG